MGCELWGIKMWVQVMGGMYAYTRGMYAYTRGMYTNTANASLLAPRGPHTDCVRTAYGPDTCVHGCSSKGKRINNSFRESSLLQDAR